MRACLTLGVLATFLVSTGLAHAAERYRQLVSTRYAAGDQLPPGAQRPEKGLSFIKAPQLPQGAKVLSAAKSAAGVAWIVTDKGSFSVRDNKYLPLTVGPARLEPGQPHVFAGLQVSAVDADPQGHLWAATNGGLFVTDGDQWWQGLDRRDGVPYEQLTCLHLAPNGDVWAGSREGAWRLRDGQFRYFWGKRWLPGNVVREIWTDDRGRAWLDTDGGFACIAEREFSLAEKAAHFDEIAQSRHIRRGFLNEIHLKVPGDVTQGYRFEVSDNDGLWNAIYVGAMAFRYAATKDPAAKRQARTALEALLELERLTGISGYPARAVVTDDELASGIDGVHLEGVVRVPGEEDKIWFRSPVEPTVWCKGDTSSDELDGHYFAWYVYHELVANEAERREIAAIVRRTTDHILDHDLKLVGHTGRPTRWGIWTPEIINHDPERYSLRPLNSLEMLAFLKVAEHITGESRYTRAYNELIDKHHFLLNALLMRRGLSGEWMGINHSDDELLYLVYYPLLRLETRPDRRRILMQSLTRTWEGSPGEQGIRGERSPLYNFMYGALTGRPCDVDVAAETLQDWPLDLIEWTVQNRHRHDVRFKTDVGFNPQVNDRRVEIDHVLPASERRLSRWNGNPWSPDGGSDGRTEDDGAAFALAYWLGVYHGFVK